MANLAQKKIEGLLKQKDEGSISAEDNEYLQIVEETLDDNFQMQDKAEWPEHSQKTSSSHIPQPKRKTQAVGTQPQEKRSRSEKVKHVANGLKHVWFRTYGRSNLASVGHYGKIPEVRKLKEHAD